jgi:hypothetical protein
VEELKLKEAREGANLIFLLPYYKHSVFYGKQRIRNLWVVSDLQLYLDLHNYPIRGLEQAEHLYEKRLKHIIEGWKASKKEYPSWFSRFIKNLQKNFSDPTADGILMISSQRPAGAFPKLTEEQFREYVLGIFRGFIEELTAIRH